MEIEVHQRGGVLGMDRRYLVKDGTIEVVDKGQSRGTRRLEPEQIARIDELASSAAAVRPARSGDLPVSDAMETDVAIRHGNGARNLSVRSGDSAPPEVWDLIGEVSRASDA